MKKMAALTLALALALLTACSGTPAEAETTVLPTETTASPTEATVYATETTVHPRVDIEAPVGDVVEIREKMFIAQTNDIYMNAEDYLGKAIRYEGIFDVDFWAETGTTYYYVIRYGPGCCGDDGEAGFEVRWEGEYPEQNDWVEAVGILEAYEEEGYQYLRLALSSLTVLPTRGAEFVSQ